MNKQSPEPWVNASLALQTMGAKVKSDVCSNKIDTASGGRVCGDGAIAGVDAQVTKGPPQRPANF